MRRVFGFFLVCGLFLPGCPASENALLLEVRTQADVADLRVNVLDGEGRRRGELMVSIDRSRDDINNREPIRLVIPVGEGGPVTVLIAGEAPAGAGSTRLLATRCYVVTGTLRDDVLLVAVGSSVDADMDGFPAQTSVTCRDLDAAGGVVGCDIGTCPDELAGDCDDANPNRFPGNDFVCMNGVDENCRDDGLPGGDEPCGDNDEDGWPACPGGAAPGTCDCADDNPLRNPDAVENDMVACNDGIDQDCDTRDALCDLDMDGFPAQLPTGGAPDCDDTNPAINPDATELCDDRIDNNCNLLIDEGAACSPNDLDRDGHNRCPAGSTACTTCDCDDCNAAVNPAARAICDGLDNITGAVIGSAADPFADCPGDADGDGDIGSDCAPMDARRYFGAPENCSTPELEACVGADTCTMVDADMDGYVAAERQDCDDADPSASPSAAEMCDSRDNDCDMIVNERSVLDGLAMVSGADVMRTGCVFDPVSCGSPDGACAIDFFRPMGDLRHCGGCARDCNPDASNRVADECSMGNCVCSFDRSGAACIGGETCCPDGCVDRQTDERNCGLCGTLCGPAFSADPDCIAGSCICEREGAPCGGSEPNCCGTGCVNLLTDNANCGSCGFSCGARASCRSGMCVCDSPDTDNCDGDFPTNGCEADLTLPGRCGDCRTDCNATLPSVATTTCGGSVGARLCEVATCDPGRGNCDGLDPNGCERNLNDVTTCGAACPGTNCNDVTGVTTGTCSGGVCGIATCDTGLGDCDGIAGTGCETSLYVPSACGTTCSPRTDCFALDRVATASCPTGSCVINTCDPGYAHCDASAANGCEVNLNSTTTCGSSCTTTNCTLLSNVAMSTCGGGACGIATCNTNFGNCDGTVGNGCETNFTVPATCGSGCGSVTNCNALTGVATAGCSGGACTITTCNAGLANCDSMVGNGCERTVGSATSCGNCTGTIDCATLQNIRAGSAGCSGGACTFMCRAGFGDCDMDPTNGCEVDFSQATTCGMACGSLVNCTNRPNSSGGSCMSGVCSLTCNTGFGNCDGLGGNGCENPLNTPAFCGSCTTMCSGATPLCCAMGGGMCRASCM